MELMGPIVATRASALARGVRLWHTDGREGRCPLVSLRMSARVAGVLGGVCWVGRAVLDELGAPAAAVDALHWGGLALIALALIGIGAGLVSSSALWLQVIVAICLPALVWAVLETLRIEVADRWVEGVFGALLAAYCLLGLVLRRPRPARRPHGAHAR